MLRLCTLNDIESLNIVQNLCYESRFHEDPYIFHSIIEYNMSIVALSDDNDIIGYALVHPIQDPYMPPCLNANIDNSTSRDHVFIHDISVIPSCRRAGVAKAMVEMVLDCTKNTKSISLISVQNSSQFWSQFGFTVSARCEGFKPDLSSYGADALHMELVR